MRLDTIGFSADDLARLLDPGVQGGLTVPDEIPDPPDDPVTRLGDLWLPGPTGTKPQDEWEVDVAQLVAAPKSGSWQCGVTLAIPEWAVAGGDPVG
jgi:hypothetical protein